MIRSPLFGDSCGCIVNPSGHKGISALAVIERDLHIQFNTIDCVRSGQSVNGWDAQLEEILADGLVGATEHLGLTVGAGAIPNPKRSYLCDAAQFEREIALLSEAKPPGAFEPWTRTKPKRRSLSAFRVRRTRVPSLPLPILRPRSGHCPRTSRHC